MANCTHLDEILVDRPEHRRVRGMPEDRGTWMHLRVCRTCGKVGCCDSSPNRHASRHAHESQHPIITSMERGEDWSWCFVDEIGFIVADQL